MSVARKTFERWKCADAAVISSRCRRRSCHGTSKSGSPERARQSYAIKATGISVKSSLGGALRPRRRCKRKKESGRESFQATISPSKRNSPGASARAIAISGNCRVTSSSVRENSVELLLDREAREIRDHFRGILDRAREHESDRMKETERDFLQTAVARGHRGFPDVP